MDFNLEQLKQKIAESKAKVSELDILISQLDSKRELQQIDDDHPPVDGQPFIYQFLDQKILRPHLPGIELPTVDGATAAGDTEIGFFSGYCQIDSDASFICTDIQAVLRRRTPGIDRWFPLQKADCGPTYFNDQNNLNIGIDFGFRFIDEGTGRKLFQAVDVSQVEQYIPARFLGNGVPLDVLGPNYTDPLAFRHVFAKNTLIKCDIRTYSKDTTVHDFTVYVGLIGYKVFGD